MRANGECGALSNENFGTVVTNLTYDKDTLTGWGKRNFNWEFSAGVQRELLPRVSADITYFRRWYGNFVIVDDLADRAAGLRSVHHHRAEGSAAARAAAATRWRGTTSSRRNSAWRRSRS